MRKSFTLIELLISIILVFMLLLSFNFVIKQLKNNLIFFSSLDDAIKKEDNLFKILHADIFESIKIEKIHTNRNNFDVLLIHTRNSLYDIDTPYVIYYISKNKNTLIRIESIFKPDIKNLELNYLIYLNIDKFTNNIDIFKIYKNKNENYILFYKEKNKPLKYFKFFL